MQVERVVRLVPMQEQGYRCNGDMRQTERNQHQPPPWQIEHAGK